MISEKEKTVERLRGTVERIIFRDEESGFTIFLLQTQSLATIVRGTTPELKAGITLDVHGSWTVHPKFGKQFFAQSCSVAIPTSTTGLLKYFGSGMIKGIGKVYGEKLVHAFGDQLIKVIEEEPQRLSLVEGIGPKRAEQITKAWNEQREFGRVLIFLREKDISPAYALKIYKQYKHTTIQVIEQNPYKLAEDIWGIGFSTADSIAQKMGIAPEDPRRISAGILHIFTTAATYGSLYLKKEELFSKTTEALELFDCQTKIEQLLHLLQQENKVVAITHNNAIWVGMAKHLRIERAIAKAVTTIQNNTSTMAFNIDEIAQKLCQTKPGTIMLHEHQVRGIITALSQKVSIITGGPGTGKTTLVRSLIEILDQYNIRYKLAAPTGRAAKRIMESTKRFASTIHRILEFDPHQMKFKHNAHNTLKGDFFIIDECSMIDVFLAHALMQAIPSTAHIVFLGDIDQLPSVGPGSFFTDMITSQIIPTTRLTQIFRQAKESLIILNAHRINHGEFPSTTLIPDKTDKDVIFIKETAVEHLLPHIRRIIEKELPKRNFSPQDLQILSPMNRGIAGTQALNHYMQQLLFPQARPKITFFGTQFSPGDRVMQLRNNYDKNVFNGDLGIIQSVDAQAQSLTVVFGDAPETHTYESDELSELTLAYATTIHKSQGSEYPVVILPVFIQHFMLLQRNLLYTGFTRAKKLCILIGEPRAIAVALKKTDSGHRVTFLQQLLSSPEFYDEHIV